MPIISTTVEPDFELHFEHALRPSEIELEQIERFNSQLPSRIIDCHVHIGPEEAFDWTQLPEYTRSSMSTTFPYSTYARSAEIDELLFPAREVGKLTFSHAFAGIDHRASNEYIKANIPQKDQPAAFGLSKCPYDIDYTIEELQSGAYSALKMYYAAQVPVKAELYDYFPPAILETAEREGLPIILHLAKRLVGSEHEVERLSSDFPDLKVVLAHVGATFAYTRQLDWALARMARLPGVYVDTSGVTDEDVIGSAIQNLGPDRILYGSDEPLNLVRDFTYVNPTMGTRLLTDIEYHWVDPEEAKQFRHLAPHDIPYNHLQQMRATLDALKKGVMGIGNFQRSIEAIFHDNSGALFGFDFK